MVILYTLTSVNIQEIVQLRGKVKNVYEGVVYIEEFDMPSFRKVIETLFNLGLKNKDKCNDNLRKLVKINMNFG